MVTGPVALAFLGHCRYMWKALYQTSPLSGAVKAESIRPRIKNKRLSVQVRTEYRKFVSSTLTSHSRPEGVEKYLISPELTLTPDVPVGPS